MHGQKRLMKTSQLKFRVIFLAGFLLFSCESKETLYKNGDIIFFKVTTGNWLEGAFFEHLFLAVNDLEPIELNHIARPVFKNLTEPSVFKEFRSDDHFIFLDSVTEFKQLHSFFYLSPQKYSKSDFQVFSNSLSSKIKVIDSILNSSPIFAHKRMRICGTVYADFDENIKWYKNGTESIKVFPDGRISLLQEQDHGGVTTESAIGVVQSTGNLIIDSAAIKIGQMEQFFDLNNKPFTKEFVVSYIKPLAFEDEGNMIWIETTGQIYMKEHSDSTIQIGYLDGSSIYKEGKSDTSVVLNKNNLNSSREKVIGNLNNKDANFSRLFKRVILGK